MIADPPKQAAVFFDRDGVLNRDVGYAHRPDQIDWTPGAAEAIRLANLGQRLVFVVTNQSGVARGFYDESAVRSLHRWMAKELAKRGAVIDAFAYCPHHPHASIAAYRRSCECRKPAAGMLLNLIAEYNVDCSRSFLIGDKPSDLRAAFAAGLRGYTFSASAPPDLPTLVRSAMLESEIQP